MAYNLRRYKLQKKYFNELQPRIKKLCKEDFRKFIISLTEIDTCIDRCYKTDEAIICPLSSLDLPLAVISLLFIVYKNKGWTEISIVSYSEDKSREALSLAKNIYTR